MSAYSDSLRKQFAGKLSEVIAESRRPIFHPDKLMEEIEDILQRWEEEVLEQAKKTSEYVCQSRERQG